jgi:hypothetical protein
LARIAIMLDGPGRTLSLSLWDRPGGATICRRHRRPSFLGVVKTNIGIKGGGIAAINCTVQLTVTTFDGRTASGSTCSDPRCGDRQVPGANGGERGQTRKITVEISTQLSPEDVQVQLFRGIPGWVRALGTLTQHVSIRPGNRTTMFAFSKTFTSEDAVLGEITFKAVATILNHADALPADNEVIAPLTVM